MMFKASVVKVVNNVVYEKIARPCACLKEAHGRSNYKFGPYFVVITEDEEGDEFSNVFDADMKLILTFSGKLTCVCNANIWVLSAKGEKYRCNQTGFGKISNDLSYFCVGSGEMFHKSPDAQFVHWAGKYAVEQYVRGHRFTVAGPATTSQTIKEFLAHDAEESDEEELAVTADIPLIAEGPPRKRFLQVLESKIDKITALIEKLGRAH